MYKTRKKYDRIFKERAVELSKKRKNLSELARELGIFPAQLINGVRRKRNLDGEVFQEMATLKKHQNLSA